MRKLLFDGQWINAEEIERAEMSWGQTIFFIRMKVGGFMRHFVTGCQM